MSDQDPAPSAGEAAKPTPVHRRLMRRFALVDGIAALFLAPVAGIYYAANALLLAFACILFAIFLYELSAILCRRFHINRKLGLVIVVVVPLLVIGLGGRTPASSSAACWARWLLGTSCSMLIAGTATSIGLSLLGVPLALILGIIAGLLDFIPYLGPIMAGVPAVLIALSVDPQLALYTTLLFLAIQMMHGYVMQPMIDSWAVSLPPALIIVMQLVSGTIFGFAGIALATPLTASLMLLVKMLYVQDILGDRDAEQRDS